MGIDMIFMLDRLALVKIGGERTSTTIYVEYRGPDLWAVSRAGWCFNNFNEWEPEPLPSSRTQEFFDRCRYPLVEAQKQAMLAAEMDENDAHS